MASTIEREDDETVVIKLRGSVIGISTKQAEVLNVGGVDRDDAPVEFACEYVSISLRNEELRELRGLLTTFELGGGVPVAALSN